MSKPFKTEIAAKVYATYHNGKVIAIRDDKGDITGFEVELPKREFNVIGAIKKLFKTKQDSDTRRN
jgi:hypothetical protein